MKTTANGHDGTSSHRSLLRSNLQLQRALGERIASINKRKERNRRAAGEAVAASLAATGGGGDGGTGSISNRRVEGLLDQRRLRLQQHQKVTADAATNSTCKSTTNPTATATSTPTAPGRKRKRSASIKSARGWQQMPNRKWHRRYFVDAEGSTPQPNNDVARRAQWLRDVASSLPSDTLSYHHGSGGKEETDNGA